MNVVNIDWCLYKVYQNILFCIYYLHVMIKKKKSDVYAQNKKGPIPWVHEVTELMGKHCYFWYEKKQFQFIS